MVKIKQIIPGSTPGSAPIEFECDGSSITLAQSDETVDVSATQASQLALLIERALGEGSPGANR